jgi:hypothetical protein
VQVRESVSSVVQKKVLAENVNGAIELLSGQKTNEPKK